MKFLWAGEISIDQMKAIRPYEKNIILAISNGNLNRENYLNDKESIASYCEIEVIKPYYFPRNEDNFQLMKDENGQNIKEFLDEIIKVIHVRKFHNDYRAFPILKIIPLSVLESLFDTTSVKASLGRRNNQENDIFGVMKQGTKNEEDVLLSENNILFYLVDINILQESKIITEKEMLKHFLLRNASILVEYYIWNLEIFHYLKSDLMNITMHSTERNIYGIIDERKIRINIEKILKKNKSGGKISNIINMININLDVNQDEKK